MDRPLDGYVDVNRDRWKGDRPDSSFECGAHKAKAPENQCFRWFPSAGKQKGRPKPPLASRLFPNSLQVRRLPQRKQGDRIAAARPLTIPPLASAVDNFPHPCLWQKSDAARSAQG